jgi:cysteine desulfurase
MIYFDYNATTPVDQRVLEVMLPFLTQFYGNPSSLYKVGRLARSAIDMAREQVAALVGCKANQVIFTSGGTEANVLALHSTDPQMHWAISAVEHPSISKTALKRKLQGHTVDIIAVDHNGLVLSSAVEALQLKPPAIVSIMLANNETGCIQPIAEHADKLRTSGITVHTDAVQALGKIPIDFNQLGVNRMSISSHKIYGPKGCGALIIDKGSEIEPLFNGEQERGLRAGTENVAAIVGFGKAAELALAELELRTAHLLSLRLKLEQTLAKIPKLSIFAQYAERLSNTVQFGISGLEGEMLVMQLDQKNIAVSSGSACASEGGKPSPVLTAMGVEPALAKSAIRVSLGKQNTQAEIDRFVLTLTSLI